MNARLLEIMGNVRLSIIDVNNPAEQGGVSLVRKWSRWLVRNLITAVFVSCLTVIVTMNMIEIYMNRLLDRAAVLEEKRVELDELLAHLSGVSAAKHRQGDLTPWERITQDDGETAAEPNDVSEEDGREGADANPGDEVSSTGDPGEFEKQDPADAIPVFGYLDLAEDAAGDELVMSAKEFVMKQEEMSEEDKLTVFSMLFSKVPQHEFQNMSYYLEDGLTAGEIKEIYRIFDRYLSEEEMRELANILQKYE